MDDEQDVGLGLFSFLPPPMSSIRFLFYFVGPVEAINVVVSVNDTVVGINSTTTETMATRIIIELVRWSSKGGRNESDRFSGSKDDATFSLVTYSNSSKEDRCWLSCSENASFSFVCGAQRGNK